MALRTVMRDTPKISHNSGSVGIWAPGGYVPSRTQARRLTYTW